MSNSKQVYSNVKEKIPRQKDYNILTSLILFSLSLVLLFTPIYKYDFTSFFIFLTISTVSLIWRYDSFSRLLYTVTFLFSFVAQSVPIYLEVYSLTGLTVLNFPISHPFACGFVLTELFLLVLLKKKNISLEFSKNKLIFNSKIGFGLFLIFLTAFFHYKNYFYVFGFVTFILSLISYTLDRQKILVVLGGAAGSLVFFKTLIDNTNGFYVSVLSFNKSAFSFFLTVFLVWLFFQFSGLVYLIFGNKGKKNFYVATFCLTLGAVLYLPVTILYLKYNEYSPDNDKKLIVYNPKKVDKQEKLYEKFSLLSWNIGYGGLDNSADNVFDGGTKVQSLSKKNTENNLDAVKDLIKDTNPDFLFLQEVDRNSKRSYYFDQIKKILDYQHPYYYSFATNFSVKFVPAPIFNPIGKVNA